jgi:hypothetical protein
MTMERVEVKLNECGYCGECKLCKEVLQLSKMAYWHLDANNDKVLEHNKKLTEIQNKIRKVVQ